MLVHRQPVVRMTKPLRLGYDCTLVNPPNLEESECSICLLVLREPHLISCCGHYFCRHCIAAAIQKNGECCPICRNTTFTTMHNKGLERKLKSLVAKCENKHLGCTWSDELGNLDRHLEAVCLYVNVGCKHGCSTVTKRKDIAEHENQCGRRPFSCCYCNAYASTYDNVVTAHHPVCSNAPVPCPNGCDAVLKRPHLKQHTDDACPNAIVECSFSYCGCSERLKRLELPAHLKTKLHFHMSMLSKVNKQLLSEVQRLKAEVPQLKAEIQRLKVEVHGLKAEVPHLKEEVQELKNGLREHKSKADAVTSYLKTSPTLSQDVYISVEIEQLQSLVDGQPLQQKIFYSHFGGYKMQLQIFCSKSIFPLNAVHLYPRIYLMKGEFDELLSWPFEGVVTVSTPLSSDKMYIDFSDAPQECKMRVLNRDGIAETGVSHAAIIVDVNRFRHGRGDYRGVFKVEKVELKRTSNEYGAAVSRYRPNTHVNDSHSILCSICKYCTLCSCLSVFFVCLVLSRI